MIRGTATAEEPDQGLDGTADGLTTEDGTTEDGTADKAAESTEEAAESRRGLARSSLLMAAGTLVSRASGLVRQVLQAGALGTGLLASTYNTANTVPMSLYTLLIGGALNSVLVPQLVRARATDADGGKAFEQRLVTMVTTILAVGTAAAVWAAPQIISLYQPDTPRTHGSFELTVTFARFLLPQVFFYGLYFILGQVLNAREKFGAMMWTPVLNNVVLVTMFGLYLGLMNVPDKVQDISAAQVHLLGVGTTIGIALQGLALVPYVAGAGFRFRPRFDWRGTGLGKSVSAAKWTLLFVLANLVDMTVVTHYANAADQALPTAGVGYSAYSYAQLIWMLPQSVATVSLVTALLPRISLAVAQGRLGDFRSQVSGALSTSAVVIVPAALFFVAFGPQTAQVLFAHGAADAASTVPLGQMLQAFGIGLIPFSAQYLLLRGFYAFEDTRTPFWTAFWMAAVDIALVTACHVYLPARWAVTGMAGAYAVRYAFGLALTAWRLRRRIGGRIGGGVLGTHVKLIVAAGAAAALGWATAHACGRALGTAGTAAVLGQIAAGGAVMAVVYLAAARILRVGELSTLPLVGRLPGLR